VWLLKTVTSMQTKFRAILVIFLVLWMVLSIPLVNALGGEALGPMNLTGKISVKGNAPHTYLCLTTDKHIDYKLSGAQQDYIMNQLQQRIVTLRGVVTQPQIGPGFPAEFEVIEVIE
jgi:hypothetical protein